MKANPTSTTTARLLAGMFALHLLILRPPPALLLPAIAILFVGEVFRLRQIDIPGRWNVVLVIVSLAATVVFGIGTRPAFFFGTMAGMAGATALLARVTPTWGLWILFSLLILLLTIVLTPFASVGASIVIGDVVVVYLLAEWVRRPPGLELSFWRSLLRSLRVAVPVALVVSTVFWLFPNLSFPTTSSFTGFSGGGDLSPGGIAALAQSRRIALVASFPEGQALPSGADLYWRGQVLNHNAGLRWTDEGDRSAQERTLLDTAPAPGFRGWSYHLDLTANYGGIVPVLDHALFVEARRAGVEVAVFDRGAAVLNAVGRGSLALEVMSSSDPMKDAPLFAIARGDVAVPENPPPDAALLALTERLIRPDRDLTANLEALAGYFRNEGFRYTLRPGRVKNVPEFLFEVRRGFCGHYAAAAANLLRLGGVPARIVTGFRGGKWNPWLRTLTVRDSDAHAWVEAWDGRTGLWRRFDPTDAVAPEGREQIARNMNPASWTWYRRGWSYGQARVTMLATGVKQSLSRIMSSDVWEYVQPVLSVLLLLLMVVWWIRRRRNRANGWVLDELERRAEGSSRSRRPGETPLAWLGRLQTETEDPTEKDALEELARVHESRIYGESASVPLSDLRRAVRRLLRLWRVPLPRSRSGW